MPLQIKESKFQIQSHKCRYLKHYFMGSTRSIHGPKPFGSSPVARNVKLTTYSLKCLFGFLIIFVISGSRCVTVACGGWGWGASLLFVENAYSEFNNSFGKPFVVLRCFIWGWAGNQTRTLSDSFDFPGPKGGSEAAVECLICVSLGQTMSISGQKVISSDQKSTQSVSIFQNGHTIDLYMINIVINHFSIEPCKSFFESLWFKRWNFGEKSPSCKNKTSFQTDVQYSLSYWLK